MEVFEVVYHDCVRFGTQLLKGEAQIWWKGVQAAHQATYGPLSWHDFVRQFERRFYPVTFLDKMKIDLHNYVQDKKTVVEYEVGFNIIVRFVPYVARNDVEKARQFQQGLKPSIRHMLGAFPVVDFRSTVEQALGIELQEMYTDEIRQSSSRDHLESKGQSSGPVHKQDQPYHGNSEQSRTSGQNSPQYRAIPKPRMGMVCFPCGDPHRCRECTWSGECSLCGQNHKDVVCRKNPNGKVRCEEISSSASSGTVQMLATPPSTYWSVPPDTTVLDGTPSDFPNSAYTSIRWLLAATCSNSFCPYGSIPLCTKWCNH
ncbi:hypothetical protein PVAP13_4KG181615 [Panicum virgatum]|uniref:Retrotransposon gag domain-containing protein n=1 Tax=Panicum virgatum TaxID=38727 RepID=A0A8T0TII8_PANVG|nr:hypothetical protein PVAP13_4KG181615 [Panicum virgatum]